MSTPHPVRLHRQHLPQPDGRGASARGVAARGLDQVTVSSAGTGAWDGAPVSEGAYLVGLENGLDLSDHRARLLTREIGRRRRSDPRHVRPSPGAGGRAGRRGQGASARCLCGRDEAGRTEVTDPFGSDLASYRAYLRRAAGADRSRGQPRRRHGAVIDGSTRVFAILGDPVAHSLSPAMQNAAFRVLGLPAVYVALRCAPDDVPGADPRAEPRGRRRQRHGAAQGGRGASRWIVRSRAVERLGACNTFWGENGATRGRQHRRPGPPRGPRRAGDAARAVAGDRHRRRRARGGGRGPRAWRRGGRGQPRSADRRRRLRGLGARRWAWPSARPMAADRDQHHAARPHAGRSAPARAAPPPGAAVALDMVYARGETAWIRAMRAAGPPGGRRPRDARGAGRGGARALVSRRAGPGRGHARGGRCRGFAEALAGVERWLLPPACLLCQAPVPAAAGDALVCELCRSRWEPVTRPVCERCGQPAFGDLECRLCAGWPAGLDAGAQRGLARRHGARSGASAQVRRLVAGRRTLAARDAGSRAIDRAGMLDTGAARRAAAPERGIQPERADRRGAGRAHGLPVRPELLRRRGRRAPRPRSRPKARQANVAGAFAARRRCSGLACVLVDDVFTTGATLAEAGRRSVAAGRRGWRR